MHGEEGTPNAATAATPRERERSSAPPPPAPPGEAAPAPPLLRDLWAWLTVASVAPILWLTRGTPRGEAVAEDFDFLRRAVLEGGGSWFDGGGSAAYWRPLANQAYFRAFGGLLLDHPGLVSAFHFVLLALAGLLIYRALRATWSGPHAAAAASFPLLAAASRSLATWSSNIADLGAMFLLAVALHERSRRRLATGLAAAAAALLCKEFALVGVLMLAFVPDGRSGAGRERRRWLIGTGIVSVAWGAAYAGVRAAAHLRLPHGLESDPALLATPLPVRLGWTIRNGIGAAFSVTGGTATTIATVLALLGIALAAFLLFRRAGDVRAWRGLRAWTAWGGAYALGCWLALAPIFPLWSPYRSVPGSVGFGIAAVGLAGAVHPLAPAGLVVARLVLLAAAPPPPARIAPEVHDPGAFFDYPRLVRLQRLMVATRDAVHARFPALPHGSLFAWHDLPLSAEYAFDGATAWQLWYRDSTLGIVPFDSFAAHPELPVRALLSYQPRHDPQIVLIDPAAEREKIRGVGLLREGHWDAAIAAFDRADSLLTDRRAMVFRGDVAGRRAYCLAQLGQWNEADLEARMAVRVAAEDVGARYVVATAHAVRHEYPAALAQLDTLLAISPKYEEALATRAQLIALTRRAEPAPPPNTSPASAR